MIPLVSFLKTRSEDTYHQLASKSLQRTENFHSSVTYVTGIIFVIILYKTPQGLNWGVVSQVATLLLRILVLDYTWNSPRYFGKRHVFYLLGFLLSTCLESPLPIKELLPQPLNSESQTTPTVSYLTETMGCSQITNESKSFHSVKESYTFLLVSSDMVITLA